ncbi:MAG: two-component system sensor histidine kinase NtrB [Desulfovibrionales bacterium]
MADRKALPPEEAKILERIVARICVVRLVALGLLIIPLTLTWIWEDRPQGILIYLDPQEYAALIVTGFALTIIYLLAWSRIRQIMFFLKLQLVTDYLISTGLIALSGGLKSGFVFVLLGLTYLYARTLGFVTGVWFAALAALFLAGCGMVQFLYPGLWGYEPFPGSDLLFTFFLQVFALGLILILTRMSRGQGKEEKLIQDLHSKERALRQAQILKSLVFDWMESGLLVVDEHGMVSAINRQAGIWAGTEDAGEVVGRPLKEYFPAITSLWQEHKSVPSDRLEIYEREGKVLYGLRITPLPDKGALIIFSDITPVRKLENRLRNMEKLAAVGELAAGLAHEMKNPLAGIKASLQLIAQGDLEEIQATRLNRVILRDIDRLDSLLKNFLVFARPSMATPESLDLGEAMEECLSILKPRFPEVTVQVTPKLDETTWSWDKNQFIQVTLNLLLNSFEVLENRAFPHIEIELQKSEHEQCLIIRDNGPGIEPDKAGRIFDPFFTTKESGTGLGLSIAQRLAGQNSSWVELAAAKGGGTEARIHYIPSFREDQMRDPVIATG